MLYNLSGNTEVLRPLLTQLIKQGSDGTQDHFDGTLGLAGIILRLLGIVGCLCDDKQLLLDRTLERKNSTTWF